MDIYEFVNLLSDDGETISIWDYAKEKEVYKGSARDAVEDYGDCEIIGIDLVPKFCKVEETIVLNIETEAEAEKEEDVWDRWEVEPSRDDWDEEE